MATEAQVAANRINGLKGGVKTEAGKAISRLNARKHGIFGAALTEGDSEELRGLVDELTEELNPEGIVERLLVDKLAVTYLRMQRCARAEALHFRSRWNSNPAHFGKFGHDQTVVQIGVYDARLTGQFLRLLREIEGRQKTRAAQREKPQITHGSAVAPLSIAQTRNERPFVATVATEALPDAAEVPDAGPIRLDSPRSKANGCILRGGNDGAQAAAVVSQAAESVTQEMKNEPNSVVGVAQPFDKLRAVSNVERPPSAVESASGSDMRGNDESQAGAPVPQEMKNEPNLPVALDRPAAAL